MIYDKHTMEAVLNIYKPQGMTPLQVLDALRKEYVEYRDEKMTYAGRLDPMAEGVLIVLIGDAVHRKEEFLNLDKTYEVEVLFGFGTDTHDLLGMPVRYDMDELSDKWIREEVNNMEGIFQYPFPNYSSKPVNGKPLFQWAREGRLEEIVIPKRTMKVCDVNLLGMSTITIYEVMDLIGLRIENVEGDFRQEAIKNKWSAVLTEGDPEKTFCEARIEIRCASGTYIRTLVHELGKRLGDDATVTKLVRTKVGDYSSANTLRLK